MVFSQAQTDGAAIYRPRLLGLLGRLGLLGLLLPPLALEESAALPLLVLPLPVLPTGSSSAIL